MAVLRNGDKLDMAYSLHSLGYDLKTKQRKPENAENLKEFSESLNDGDGNDKEDDDDSPEISVHLREEFFGLLP